MPHNRLVTALLEKADNTNPTALDRLSEDAPSALSSLANHMEPIEASRMHTKLARGLATMLATTAKGEDSQVRLANWIAEIARRIDPADLRSPGSPAIETLTTAVEEEKAGVGRANLCWGLAPLAERLGPDEADKICRPPAEELVRSFQTETNGESRKSLVRGLAALTIRLAPKRAIQTVRLFAARMEKDGDWARDSIDGNSLKYQFYYLFGALDAHDARVAARLLVSALAEEKDPGIRLSLAAGLCRIAERMESADAAKICGPVVAEMAAALVAKTSYFIYLSDGFAIVATRAARAEAGRAAHVLADALISANDADVRRQLAQRCRSWRVDWIAPWPHKSAHLLFVCSETH